MHLTCTNMPQEKLEEALTKVQGLHLRFLAYLLTALEPCAVSAASFLL